MKGLRVIALALLLGATSTIAQTPRSPGQVGRAGGGPMRKIYSQWCIPTPDRWQTAAKLFDRSNASPVDGD
jgi:hypothetical protein